jgi:hypothetical protein
MILISGTKIQKKTDIHKFFVYRFANLLIFL